MDSIHDNWDEVEAVSMALELSEPGQPYSCNTWGNNFNNSEPLIVHGGSPYYHWWGMFENMYVPAHAFIDHTMTVHYKTNTLGSYVANTRIEEMLEDCGECYVDGIFMEEFGQEDCCEIFGGTYHGYDQGAEYDELSCSGSDAVWSSLCLCSGTFDTDGDGIADECDDCNNMSGDTNDDMTIDILDIVTVVNIILNGGINSPNYTECQLTDANYNGDAIINVLDIIQIINQVLGGRVSSDNIDGEAVLDLHIENNDLIIKINSDVDISGLQLSFYTEHPHNIIINDNSFDIITSNDERFENMIFDGIQNYVAFSINNIPFDDNLELKIENGYYLSSEDIEIVLASTAGTRVNQMWTLDSYDMEINAFTLDGMFPNPFNPIAEIKYNVINDGNMNIKAYNLLGQEIAELYSGYRESGEYKLIWNAENIPSGVYFVQVVHSDGQIEKMKAVLLK